MHRRLGNSAVPGNLLGLARLYERIINDEPPLAIQGARIGSHSVFHFFHRQMCCCTRDSCHTFPLLFSVITSFILSQYADWYQTMTAQALLGQTYPSPADLWAGLDERREVLNQYLPSRALSHKAPLEAYPQAIHSGRMYRPEWEEDLLCLEHVWSYLQQGRWFRSSRC